MQEQEKSLAGQLNLTDFFLATKNLSPFIFCEDR